MRKSETLQYYKKMSYYGETVEHAKERLEKKRERLKNKNKKNNEAGVDELADRK